MDVTAAFRKIQKSLSRLHLLRTVSFPICDFSVAQNREKESYLTTSVDHDMTLHDDPGRERSWRCGNGDGTCFRSVLMTLSRNM